MQKHIRDWIMAGRFYKSNNCYNREEDELFRMCRTINLIEHASKIMFRLLGNKAEYFIGRTQFGFKKGCGTREAISGMSLLLERRLE